MLVTHTLKRSAGIGGAAGDDGLDARVEELADALVVIISATGFLEYDDEVVVEPKKTNGWFH